MKWINIYVCGCARIDIGVGAWFGKGVEKETIGTSALVAVVVQAE